MSFLISNAFAAAETTVGAKSDSTFSLIMIAAIFVLFYMMLIRPQNKRAKEHKELMSQLKKGDEVITTSGILAKVINLGEQYVKVSIAEGVEINLQKGAISIVLPKGTLKTL